MREIILASASKQRYDILKRTGIPFLVEESGYEEDVTLALSPSELVKHLAEGKAEAVAARHQGAVIIGADTVVVCDGQIFGKPLVPQRAREMLLALSGRTHRILTGFVIIDTKTGSKVARAVETKVSFHTLSDTQIDSYVATGEPLEKAGGYAIQGGGAKFVERLEGEVDNVVGLPLQTLLEELAKFGITG